MFAYRAAVLLLLALAARPALAADPPAASGAPSAVRKARAFVDRMVHDMERMCADIESAGGDQARIQAVGERFKLEADAMRRDAEGVNKKLTALQTKELEAYARIRMAPVMTRLMTAMAKAQAAGAPPSFGPAPVRAAPQTMAETDDELPDRGSSPAVPNNPALQATSKRQEVLANQVTHLLSEARTAAADAAKLAAIEARLQGLLDQFHDDQHAALVPREDRDAARNQWQQLVIPPLQRLRRVLARGGRPECAELVRSRGVVEALARNLPPLAERAEKAKGTPAEMTRIAEAFAGLRRAIDEQVGQQVEMLPDDDALELRDYVAEFVQPLQKRVADALTGAAPR